MASSLYRFGRFRLDAQARELFEDERRVNLPLSTIDCLIHLIRHRDRPVGRDELAAAVWGRVDVSEVSLNHAVMRLRRLLGDTGNDQRVIRTVPRLGYRWVMDGTVEGEGDPDVSAMPADPAAPVAAPQSQPPLQSRWRVALAAVLAAAVLLGGLALWRSRPAVEPAPAAPLAALVLPAAVDAPEDWRWLRLGLLDLISSHLQRGGLAAAPSETVVALLEAHGGEAGIGARHDLAHWLIRPSARRTGEGWAVRVEADDGTRSVVVETRAADAVQAARGAADELLIKLGRTPPADTSGDASLAQETLQRRVNAAVLAGQVDVARALIAEAAPALRASPEIALSQASIEFFSGAYEACRQQTEALLARLPADTGPVLRARALNTLGAAFFRLGRIDEAEAAYAESIRLVERADEPGVLARAYIGIGGVASQRMQLEAAAISYGRARTLHELRGDAFGVAAVDLNLGLNAMQRGQPAAALTLLRSASERFEKLAAEDALAATLAAMVDVHLLLLEPAQALALSERFGPLQSHGGNRRQRWELTLSRAGALAANGRLDEAETLIARIFDGADPVEDAPLRLQATSLAARIALSRGRPAKAEELASAALTPALELRSRLDYAWTWSTRIRGLQGSGRTEAARAEVMRLLAWSEADPNQSDRVYAALAQAGQAAAEARVDEALDHYAEALDRAARRAIPEELVAVGQPYVDQLLASGRIEEAVAVNGRIAPWADRDLRAAWSEAAVYRALGQAAPAAAAQARAQRLAGERALPEGLAALP
ncbi:MAG: hypothetical protein DI564_09840 [Rhodanobacter denitrificans]|uniref:OmpR/PhoB-type domain-containing protein n=1 Tax=Rhodanobacter denitrificans TaxID=666685 RepID=A0A2W5KGF4_9GAMM|nr:MAG: hypothetical protein DI564_09840 [Rhodanobacter denitrificans]